MCGLEGVGGGVAPWAGPGVGVFLLSGRLCLKPSLVVPLALPWQPLCISVYTHTHRQSRQTHKCATASRAHTCSWRSCQCVHVCQQLEEGGNKLVGAGMDACSSQCDRLIGCLFPQASSESSGSFPAPCTSRSATAPTSPPCC